MADTVKLPGVGPVKKGWAVGGAAVLAGILAVAYYRHARNASAQAASADGTTAQQDPNAVDPATGLTYAEEAAGISSGDLAGYGSAYGDTSGIVGYDAQGNPVYADQVGYGPSPSFVTNGDWAQAAEQYLVSTTGADAGTVAAALGTYLAGQPLTEAQASVVHSAIGFFGQPPQAGSNGYPPALKMAAPQTGGTGGTVPPPRPPQPEPSSVSRGHVVSVSNNRAVVGWTPAGPARQWQVKIAGPDLNGRTAVVSVPQATYRGLAAGHNYQVTVTPWANGKAAGPSGEIHFRTTRKK